MRYCRVRLAMKRQERNTFCIIAQNLSKTVLPPSVFRRFHIFVEEALTILNSTQQANKVI